MVAASVDEGVVVLQVASSTRSKRRQGGEQAEEQEGEGSKRRREDGGEGTGSNSGEAVQKGVGVGLGGVACGRKRKGGWAHVCVSLGVGVAQAGTEAVEAEHGTKRQRGIEAELGGVRRSKRVAERMEGGTEQDTEHAHRRKRHESASRSVPDGVTPWRDK